MRIYIIVYQNPFNQNSAGANRLISLLEPLAKHGFFVSVLIYGGFVSDDEKEKWKKKGIYNQINYEYVFEYKIYPLKIRSYFSNYFSYVMSNFILKKISRKIISNSIVWVESWKLGFELVYNLKLLQPENIYFTEFSEYIDIYRQNKMNFVQYYLEKRNHNIFLKKSLKSYDGIALMTQALINEFKNYLNSHIKFLHLPMTVDLERFQSSTDPLSKFQLPYIAFVGVMNDAKDGISNLIKAFNIIKDKFPSYKLYLVGAWHYDTPIHLHLIKVFCLEERVFWMNEYAKDFIPNIIGNADLLVLPRPDSKQARGGFPTKLGEYLATGKPVCATQIGEIPNYLTDNVSVFFAEPGSVDSFAESMERALGNYENAKRVGENGRKVAEEHFDKNIQVNKMIGFLEDLVSQGPKYN